MLMVPHLQESGFGDKESLLARGFAPPKGSAWPCLLILCAGGCVCVPSEAQRMNSLAKTMTTMQVNMAP
jgi:hypothetical protein